MKKALAMVAMLMMASSAAALERSMDGRGVMGGHDGGDRHSAAQRGDRSAGDKDRTIFGREAARKDGLRFDRGGRRGDRE